MTTNKPGAVEILLPKPPKLTGEAWEALRRELRRFKVDYTVLGLTPSGRPRVRFTGKYSDLRAWLDQCGYRSEVING